MATLVRRLCMFSMRDCWVCQHTFDDDEVYEAGISEHSGAPVPVMHFVCVGEHPGAGILTCSKHDCVEHAERDIAAYKLATERLTLSEMLPSLHSVVKFWRPTKGWVQSAVIEVPASGIFVTGENLMCKVRFQMDSEFAAGAQNAYKSVPLRDILEQTPQLCREAAAWIKTNAGSPEAVILGRALAFSQL